jgi:hypothetical protein
VLQFVHPILLVCRCPAMPERRPVAPAVRQVTLKPGTKLEATGI